MTATEATPTTVSPVGWFEIVASDPAASESFYSDLLGWHFGDGPMGGIPSPQAGLPATYAIFSIMVPDVGVVCDRINELGGTVLLGPQVLERGVRGRVSTRAGHAPTVGGLPTEGSNRC